MTARAGVVRASWRAGSAVCAVWPRWFRRYSATRDPIQRQQDGFMRTSEAAPPDDPAGDQSVSPEALVALRGDMLRFARLQLRDAAAAEDIVQESLEAALRCASTFAGQSALKTWVFAIVRNRIVDHLRQSQRSVNLSSLGDDDGAQSGDEQLDALFNDSGRWRAAARPAAWPDPEASMRSRQFWRAFEDCLAQLPPNTGRAFMMREVLGFEPAEICERMGIRSGNCHVMLHRARMKLRSCLERAWGPGEGRSC